MKEAFNIKIEYNGREVTLTILREKDYYKIIYFGGIMGAIRKAGRDWELVSAEDIEAGDLPQYTPDLKGERLELVLDENTANAIGEEIELYDL